MIKFEIKDKGFVIVLIAEKGYSLRKYAKKIGVSHPLLSQVLNKKRNPSPETAKKIAGGIDKRIDDIFFVTYAHTASNEGKGEKKHNVSR